MEGKDILRKLLLCVLLLPTGVLAHVRFGHEYRGPGMNQIDVLIVVAVVSVVLTVAFALISLLAGWIARRTAAPVRLLWDAGLFLLFFSLAVAAGLTARVTG